jgi:hypothetical protein
MQDAFAPQSPTRVVAVPSADREFGQFVQACLSPVPDVGTLEGRLRMRYPEARVQVSEVIGRDGVWYAYRDGHWQIPAASRETGSTTER